MSDLILNINISESKKKGRIVLETYDGTIPHLKNRQYSGPLRNANINGITSVDNLSLGELELVRGFLDSPKNIQINKYQHIISNSGIWELIQFSDYGCLFYRDKNTPMFQVEKIVLNGEVRINYTTIGNLQVAYDKNDLYILTIDIDDQDVARQIVAKAYVSINIKEHPLDLVFDYDDYSVSYTEKERTIGSDINFRDFGFEERAFQIVKNCGWNYTRDTGFIYAGKDFQKDVSKLVADGIVVFTDNEKRISVGDFSNIQVSYGIDWFDIKGSITIEGEEVNVADLIDLRAKKDNWVEFNGKIIAIPESLGSALKASDKSEDALRIGKDSIVDAIEIAFETNGRKVDGIETLFDFKNVTLDIDKNLLKVLREYQEVGVRWLLSLHKNGFGGCLADDMGLGKTLQIISYLSDSSMDNTNNLIIVPKTLLLNWEKEFKKFSPGTSILIYHGTGRNEKTISQHKVILTTYGTVLNDIDKISDITFDNVIIDEAQNIKNSKSKNYRAVKCLKAKTRFILTGTPVENNIQEFWGLMQLINPTVFSKRKLISKITDNQQKVDKIKRISMPFILRRLKKDVLKDLPMKQEQVLYCKMDAQQRELYEDMLLSIRYEISRKSDRFAIKSNSIMLNGLLYLQEICCHPQLLDKKQNPKGCRESAKYDLLLEVLGSLYESGHKVVIFSRFTKMLKIIEKQILKMHYNCYYLDGKTNDRMKLVDEFEASQTGVFLISLKAGGTGLNLVSADTAIIYDPWWNPASEKQAEDRIYRIGQKNNVMIYRMIVEDSIEEKVQLLQGKKLDLYDDLLNGHESPTGMTAEIMRDLLMN